MPGFLQSGDDRSGQTTEMVLDVVAADHINGYPIEKCSRVVFCFEVDRGQEFKLDARRQKRVQLGSHVEAFRSGD